MNARIRDVLRTAGRLPADVATLGDDADLHAAGLTSFGAVEVMLRIEEEFGVEFPDGMMTAEHFRSVSALVAATRALTARAVTPS